MSQHWENFVVGFDIHGTEQDPEANRAFFDFIKVFKPKHRICGGDLMDFCALRKGASEAERDRNTNPDVEAGLEWLVRLKADTWLEGNHDKRIRDLYKKAKGIHYDYAQKTINEIEKVTSKLKCQVLPYHKINGVYRLGHLKIIHGFHHGITAARKAAQIYGSVLQGHGHGIQQVSIEGIDNRIGRMCGALCKLDMDYVETSMSSLMWRHGWAYGIVNSRTGAYNVWQAEHIDGKWLLPTGFREI